MTCKRLFTIWVRSLNLEHIIPKNNDSQIKFKIKTIKPGKNKKKFKLNGNLKIKQTNGKMTKLWQNIYIFRNIILNICVNKGRGSCFIILSELTKTAVASMIVDEISPQTISPTVRNGKNSDMGDLKRPPNIKPIQAIITPVEIVIQNGPNEDLL